MVSEPVLPRQVLVWELKQALEPVSWELVPALVLELGPK